MAKTYGDLITECITFPYSSECYEMQKESAEISLMASYLECQMFANVQLENIMSSRNIDRSYYIESGVYEIQVLEEKFMDKVKEHGQKAWEGIKNIYEWFIKLIIKLANLLEEDNTRAQIVSRELSKITLQPEDINKLMEIINKAADDAGYKDPSDFPFKAEKAIVKMRGLKLKEENILVDILSAALTNGVLTVDSSFFKDTGKQTIGSINQVYPIGADDIGKIVKMIKNKNKDKSMAALNALNTAMNKSAKDGFKIICYGRALKKTAAKLDESLKSLNESTFFNESVLYDDEYFEEKRSLTDEEFVGDSNIDGLMNSIGKTPKGQLARQAENRLRQIAQNKGNSDAVRSKARDALEAIFGVKVDENGKAIKQPKDNSNKEKPVTPKFNQAEVDKAKAAAKQKKDEKEQKKEERRAADADAKQRAAGNDGGKKPAAPVSNDSGNSSQVNSNSGNGGGEDTFENVAKERKYKHSQKSSKINSSTVRRQNIDDSHMDTPPEGDTPKEVAQTNEVRDTVIQALTVVIGLTGKIYNILISFRQSLIQQLEQFVSSHGGALTESAFLCDDGFVYPGGFEEFRVGLDNFMY